MPTVIVYPSEGSLAVAHISDGVPAETAAALVVPAGAPYRVLDASELPLGAPVETLVADFDAEEFAVTVDPAKKAQIDLARELGSIEEWFAEKVGEGYLTEDGWRLGLAISDVTLLTGNFVLAREAAALGAPLPPVIDTNGHPHTFETIEELTALMLAYGQYRASISARYAELKAAAGV